MPLVIYDRVRETSTVAGTSDAVLLGAVTGFQSFSVVGNGNTTYYTIADQSGANWEVGIGTYSTSGPTLARTTVLSSSNAGNKVSFGAGTKDVFLTYPSERAVTTDLDNTFTVPQVISVTDNTNAALRITQLGTGNALLVEDSTNPDATPFVVDANGRVIVGNTTPIISLGITPTAQVIGSGLSSSSYLAACFANDATSAGSLYLNKTRSTTVGTLGTIVQSGDNLGVIQFLGDDGAALIRGATIFAQVDGTPGTNDMPGRLVFSTTADGASSPTERMRIDSAGRVGIGGTPLSSESGLRVSTSLTGGTGVYQITSRGSVQSDATTEAIYFRTFVSTAASAFTLADLTHYRAEQGTVGATSAITNQYGFRVNSSLIGATNNFGFRSDIASGTGRWNFYANGTAANYFAGTTTVGTLTNTNSSTLVSGGTISETVSGVQYLVASQFDVGTAPNDIPLNQYLGTLAYQSFVPFTGTGSAAPTIASATTIAPTTPIIFVSGTTAIVNITPPATLVGGGQLTIIPTGIFTTTTAGNIALASTAVVSRALIMTWDATTAKWYPSY